MTTIPRIQLPWTELSTGGNLSSSTSLDFSGGPYGTLGLTPASFEGVWTPRYWMDEPIRIQIVERTLKLVSSKSGSDTVLHSWDVSLLQKVNIASARSSQPHLELYFRDGSMINVYQFGMQLAELKALQHKLRTFATT